MTNSNGPKVRDPLAADGGRGAALVSLFFSDLGDGSAKPGESGSSRSAAELPDRASGRLGRVLDRMASIAGVAGWTADFVTGRFEVSDEAARWIGGPAGARSTAEWFATVHPGDWGRVRDAWEATRAGAPFELEYRVVVEGRVRWIRLRAAVETDDGGRPTRAIGVMQDVTDRIMADRRLATQHAVSRALAESESLVDAAPRLLRVLGEAEVWEMATLWIGDREAAVVRCVEVWIAAAGLEELAAATRGLSCESGAGLPGRVWRQRQPVFVTDPGGELGPPRSELAARTGLRGVLAVPLTHRGEVSGVIELFGRAATAPDPRFLEFLEAIGPQVGQFMERRQALEEARRFVSLSGTVLYALAIRRDGFRLLWVSENIRELMGCAPEHCLADRWWVDGLHPEDRERVLAAHPLPYEVERLLLEFRFRHRDGTYRWIRDEKRLLRGPQGEPTEIVGSWVDITERFELEQQLRQSQKMESLGELAGGVAHDFNNILAVILGNAQLAGHELPTNHPAHENLDQILRAGGRAKNLVQQILTFSRRQPARRRLALLGPVVEEGVRLLRATLPARVELVSRIARDTPSVLADTAQVEQVLVNLGTNAWHALGDRAGRVEVRLEALTLGGEEARRLPGLRPGWHVRLSVSDDGTGMDAETLSRIFEPFFTTKEPGKGSGLGLSVVHGIVKAHEGAIDVLSEPGAGTTFHVYLPVAGNDPAASAPSGLPLRLGSRERILLVDDESALVFATTKMLERLGFRVRAFVRPAEAVKAFDEAPDQFDLAIVDSNMPGMSGLEVITQFYQVRPGLPVILNSGFVAEEVEAQARRLGIREILHKPNTLEELGAALHRLLHAPSDD